MEISIPRDDYANLPGCPDGSCKEKIKQGTAWPATRHTSCCEQGRHRDRRWSRQSRDAGRKEEADTVSQFLGGIPIDHFIEVTLVAFFQIAKVVQPMTGVSAEGHPRHVLRRELPGRHAVPLNASQALAFVRQRRDNVKGDYYYNNFTDLDRERRQQAFISSLAYKLRQAGTFTNPTKSAGS